MHLLIDPRSENASLDIWSDPDGRPSWQAGASRALAVLSSRACSTTCGGSRRTIRGSSGQSASRTGSRMASTRMRAPVVREFITETSPNARECAPTSHHDGGERADQDAGEPPTVAPRSARSAGQGKERIASDVISPRCCSRTTTAMLAPCSRASSWGTSGLPQPRPRHIPRARLRERDRVARRGPARVRARGRCHRWHPVVRPSQAPLRPTGPAAAKSSSISPSQTASSSCALSPRPGAGRRAPQSSFAHTRPPGAGDRGRPRAAAGPRLGRHAASAQRVAISGSRGAASASRSRGEAPLDEMGPAREQRSRARGRTRSGAPRRGSPIAPEIGWAHSWVALWVVEAERSTGSRRRPRVGSRRSWK